MNYNGCMGRLWEVKGRESGHPKMAAAPGPLASLIAHTTTQGRALYMYNSVVWNYNARQVPEPRIIATCNCTLLQKSPLK